MRDRFLTVPINNDGINDYEYGVEGSDNLAEFTLSDEEFTKLYKSGLFSRINKRCGLMIDDYESETISADNLKKCIDLLQGWRGTFRDACNMAMKHSTFLALDF